MVNSTQSEEPNLNRDSKIILIIIVGSLFFVFMIVSFINFYKSIEHEFIHDLLLFIFVGYPLLLGTVSGPILISIAIFTYLTRTTAISKIPLNTTLHESIFQPTIQYGPVKLILPVLKEELIDELQIQDLDV